MKISKPYRIPENAMKAFLTRPTPRELFAGAVSFLKNTLEAELSYLGVPVLNGGPHEGHVLLSLMEGDKIYLGANILGDNIANDNRQDQDRAA